MTGQVIFDPSNKEELVEACRNDLLVVMQALDPIEDMIDEAYNAPGNEALSVLHRNIRALAKSLQAQVSVCAKANTKKED